MRQKLMPVMAALILFCSTGLAQEKSGVNTPVARLSYSNWYVRDWSEQQSSRICFALYDNGYYQLVKLTKDGSEEGLHGTMSPSQVSRLRKLVNAFDSNAAGAGGVLEGSESLTVDLINDRGTRRYQWVDRDHQNPLPATAVRIVHWLQVFRAEGAEQLTLRELGEQSICPPGSLKPLVPTIAHLYPASQ